MSGSERPGTWQDRLLRALLAVVMATTACDDPSAILHPPVERRLMIMMDLDPSISTQALWVTPFDTDSIRDIEGELWVDGVLIASAVVQERDSECNARLNILLWTPTGTPVIWQCLVFDHQAVPGVTYELVVRAADRPSASARTTVPGLFDVRSARATGEPPGTDSLTAEWTPSAGAYRYTVMVRDLARSPTGPNPGFDQGMLGWVQATTDTAIATRIPADEIWPRRPDSEFVIAVYAVDEALFRYMTSGSREGLFPASPMSNVTGGFGFFGSWVRHNVPIDSAGA